MLTGIVASSSGISLASQPAVAIQQTDEELTTQPATLCEVSFVADIEPQELSAPPAVVCQKNRLLLDETGRAYSPGHVSISSGDLIVNSHEGVKVPKDTNETLFSEIPLEASPGRQYVSIPGSTSPEVTVERQTDGVSVTFDGEKFSLPAGGKLKQKVRTEVDAVSRTITMELRVNDIGDVEAVDHPTKTVVPLGSDAASQYKHLAKNSGSDGSISAKDQILGEGVNVTALQKDGVLLVDPAGGDQA